MHDRYHSGPADGLSSLLVNELGKAADGLCGRSLGHGDDGVEFVFQSGDKADEQDGRSLHIVKECIGSDGRLIYLIGLGEHLPELFEGLGLFTGIRCLFLLGLCGGSGFGSIRIQAVYESGKAADGLCGGGFCDGEDRVELDRRAHV